MTELVDLGVFTADVRPLRVDVGYDWEEAAWLWDRNDMPGVHGWLTERWLRLVVDRLLGRDDPDALFLQGLAFAANALHFTQTANQEGALLMLDDALMYLGRYRPGHMGVAVDPILDTLQELRPLIVGLAPDAPCPLMPFVYRKFVYGK